MGKLNPGDPLRSMVAEHNRSVEVNDWYFSQQQLRQGGGPSITKRSSGVVWVKNSSGGDLDAGACLQFADYLLNEDHRFDDANLWLDGDTPAAPAAERFCVLKRALPDGEIGEAFISGACVATVNVTHEDHKFAVPKAGTTVLQSSGIGPIEILSPVESLGEESAVEQQLIVVLRGHQAPRLCVTASDSTYPSDSANTFGIIYTHLSFTKTEGTQTQTYTDESETVQDVAQSADGAYIPEGTICEATMQTNGFIFLKPLECAS